MKRIPKMVNHVRNRLLWYALGALLLGWGLVCIPMKPATYLVLTRA
jgi:hypothetical protein